MTLALYVTVYLALLVAYVAVVKYMAEKPEDVLQADALERAQGRAAEALVEGGRS